MIHSLLHERAYFINLKQLSDEIVAKINERLKETKGKSGSTVKIDLFGMPLEIKFFKTFSKKSKKIVDELEDDIQSNVAGIYVGPTENDPARIEISINRTKKTEQYWKDRPIEDILDNGLPKFLDELIRHEITHAFDDLVADIFKYSQVYDAQSAVNMNTERNAYLNEFLSSLIHHSRLLKYYIHVVGDVPAAMKLIVREFDKFPFVRKMSEDTKKWMLKTIYTTVDQLAQS